MPAPSRLVPCPVCGAGVGRFEVELTAVAHAFDLFKVHPCGDMFARFEYPDWVATFASEGG